MKKVQFVDAGRIICELSSNKDLVIFEFRPADGGEDRLLYTLPKSEISELIHELIRLKGENYG